jgi:hypothetical protein
MTLMTKAGRRIGSGLKTTDQVMSATDRQAAALDRFIFGCLNFDQC